jgi:hypothetical protein
MKLGLALVHLLLDYVPVLLEQPRLRALTTAMIDGEGFFAGRERGPNVVANQAFRDLPGRFENGDRSLRVNFADEVDPSGCERQHCRYLGTLAAQQFFAPQVSGGLLDGQAPQRWRRIILVPVKELRTLAREITQRREMLLGPEACGPGPVDPFDHVIAFCFPGGGMKRSSMPKYNAKRTKCPKTRGVRPRPVNAASLSSCSRSGMPNCEQPSRRWAQVEAVLLSECSVGANACER